MGFSVNLFKNRVQNRKYFYVTVVVDGRLTVGFQMERVDHVDVVQICGCRLICEVDRMLQRQIPDRKCLEFGISCMDSAFMFMI